MYLFYEISNTEIMGVNAMCFRRIKSGWRGVSVMIFPEGTRSLDGKIRPFKKGGFVLAVDAGVPIVPIIIRGTRSIMPKGRLMINPGTVKMEIGKPIDTSEYTRDTKNELVDHVRSVICDNFYQGS